MSVSSLERLTSITGISRATIAATVTQAHGPWLLHLGSRERILMLEAMATIYGAIGFRRKEAYVLREVLGCVMDLVVCGREEAGSTRGAGTGLGIHGVNVGTPGAVGIRANDNVEGNQSVLKIVKYVCLVHGIDLEAVKIVDASKVNSESPESSQSTEEPKYEPFGWPELQIGIVREAIAVAEALPGALPPRTRATINQLISFRLSCGCTVFAVVIEEFAPCYEPRRSIPSLQHRSSSSTNGSPTRRL